MDTKPELPRVGPSLLATAISAALAAPALSQPVTGEGARLEEVVVTASKREESLQDVGMSVSAFGAEELQLGGIDDVSRLELVVPGLNYAFSGNDAKFNVRGANSTNTYLDNSSIVGAFVDGIYKVRASQQTRAFFDIERVEFLRGPQGTLYGRNTFAGALNVYTARPDTEAFGGYIESSIQAYDRIRSEAAFNLPISDTLAVRLATVYDKSGGYIENDAGPDMGAQDDLSYRVSAAWTPNDDFDAVLRYHRTEEKGYEAGLFGYTFLCRNETADGVTDPFGSERNCENPLRGGGKRGPASNGPGGDPWRISQDYVRPVDLVDEDVNLILTWNVGNIQVKSLSAAYDFRNDIQFDFDFSPTPNSNGGQEETSEGWSQEFQISSAGDGPFAWTGGVFYTETEDFYSFYIYQQTQRDDSTRPVITTPEFPDGVTILEGTDIVSDATFLGGFFANAGRVSTDYLGVYFEGEYSLSDSLRITAGIRYNDEEKYVDCGGDNFTGDTNGDGRIDRVVNVIDGVAGSSPIILPESAQDLFTFNCAATDAVTSDNVSDSDYSWDNFTYRAGIEFDLSDDVMSYMTASTGYLSGSASAFATTDEQESQVLELGLRTVLLDGTLQLNGAFHYTEYTNLLTQRQEVNPETGIVITFSDNGGDIEAWGLEFDAVWLAAEGLTITGTFAYLDSEFGTFGQSNPYQLYDGEVRSFIDQAGQVTPWSPEITLGASIGYDFDFGRNGTLTPYAQFYYSDEYNTSNLLSTDPAQRQDSYTKTDLRLIWRSADMNLSVEAFVENLENADVLARGNNNGDDVVQTSFLYPRNYGLTARYSF
jgi:iron complex outermembrane receptor protein